MTGRLAAPAVWRSADATDGNRVRRTARNTRIRLDNHNISCYISPTQMQNHNNGCNKLLTRGGELKRTHLTKSNGNIYTSLFKSYITATLKL